MVVIQVTLDLAETQALNVFDDVLFMGYGTGTTTPSEGDMILETQVYRGPLDSVTKDTVNNKYTYVGKIPITQGNGSAITEIGIFTAVTGGAMACRILSPVVITKTSDDELVYTLVLKVNAVNS